MYKQDPRTGCKVLTRAGFFQREAEHEGKGRSGAEVMVEFFEDEAREMAEDAACATFDMRKRALTILQEAVREEVKARSEWHRDFWLILRQVLQYRPVRIFDLIRDRFEPSPPFPLRIARIEDVSFADGMGGGTEGLTAIAETNRGFFRFVWEREWDNGSWDEPPSEEEQMLWYPCDANGRR